MTPAIPVQLHYIYEILVTGIGSSGEGVGRVDGFTVFILGALPNEIVEARIVLLKKTYARAVLVQIKKSSPHRVTPACSVYRKCGGCQISHMEYEEQIRMKRQRVIDTVTRIGGADGNRLVRPVIPADHPFGYRNKMMLPVGGTAGHAVTGCFAQGTHDVISNDACAIQKNQNNRLARFSSKFMNRFGIAPYNEKTKTGDIRHIMGRVGEQGKLMAVIITAGEQLPYQKEWIEEMRAALPELVSLYHCVQKKPGNTILSARMRCLWGEETIPEQMKNFHFQISPNSFFQVNKEQAEKLYDTALEFCGLTGKETVIDAYCGTGTISIYMAAHAGHVIGIEIVPKAIEDAKKNARENGIINTEFITGDAGKIMPELYQKGIRPNVILCDPVRAGCSRQVLDAAVSMAPERLVYVSCNPATMSRDIARLNADGYILQCVQPVDMFPQTMHVESVCLMSRVKE